MIFHIPGWRSQLEGEIFRIFFGRNPSCLKNYQSNDIGIECGNGRDVSVYNKSFNLELSKNSQKPVDYLLKYA